LQGAQNRELPPPQAHPAPRGAASLPDSSKAQAWAAHRKQADAPFAPKAGRRLEGELANPMDPKTLASEAGDKIKKARFDPYAFSPPKAPGMDLG